ncbi:MAG: HAD-IIIA family hydrolase [bacterium]|nr:HAD-IIIA family hydrolase [bacterium]
MTEGKIRAVFFDRDGVILKPIVMDGRPRPPHSVAEYKALSGVIPSAKEVVEKVKAAGFLVFLISNQPDIAYGVISKEEWHDIQNTLAGVPFDDVFICFHRRDDNCSCMKPKPGLLLQAAEKWNIDLPNSFLVGDTKDDVGAAHAAGVKSVLVRQPYNEVLSADVIIDTLSALSAVVE